MHTSSIQTTVVDHQKRSRIVQLLTIPTCQDYEQHFCAWTIYEIHSSKRFYEVLKKKKQSDHSLEKNG